MKHRSSSHDLLCVLLCWVVILCIAVESGFAATGQVRALPDPRQIRAAGPIAATIPPNPNTVVYTKSGFRIVVDSRGVGTYGYRSVKITLSSQTKTTSDHQVTVRFSGASRYSGPPAIAVEKDIEFPLGKDTVQFTMNVPQLTNWQYVNWEVWIDGVKEESLGEQYSHFGRSSGGSYRTMFLLERPRNRFLPSLQIDTNHFEVDTLSEWPRNWTDLSNADVVTTTPADLRSFNESNPAGREALVRWVHAGGNLWVVGGGEVYENIPEIEQALGIRASTDPDEQASPGEGGSPWRTLTTGGNRNSGLDGHLAIVGDSKSKKLPDFYEGVRVFSRQLFAETDSSFVVRPFGMGTITLFQGSERDLARNGRSFKKVAEQTFYSPLGQRMDWHVRHGTSPGDANLDFNNFLVPGVGTAPVYEFQFLITLFVICIGPVNYWLFKRRSKLPMLLATVPAAALLTTCLLFAYGYLSEGVGTQVRARSFTLLDQRTGEAASWARLSYYAGIAPSDGLTIPADTLMYPILPNASNYRSIGRYASQPRTVLWQESGEAHLSEGWLRSRTPTQYLSLTARASKRKLLIKRAEDGLQVANRLGSNILMLAVCDEDGEFYLKRDLAADETAVIPKTKKLDVLLAIREVFTENEPEFPPGGEISGRRSHSGARFADGLLEMHMQGISSPMVREWKKSTYVAVTETGIEVEYGLDNAREVESFHVVKGVW